MSDAHVLILDEPTAHLDALREQELYERFAALTEGRTVVGVIAASGDSDPGRPGTKQHSPLCTGCR